MEKPVNSQDSAIFIHQNYAAKALDGNGQRIGKRCVIVNRSSGETRIIWTESETEYWTIDATSLSLAKEFESSETFRLVKSSGSSTGE